MFFRLLPNSALQNCFSSTSTAVSRVGIRHQIKWAGAVASPAAKSIETEWTIKTQPITGFYRNAISQTAVAYRRQIRIMNVCVVAYVHYEWKS